MEDQAATPDGTGQIATVTTLYRDAPTPPNITPHTPASYQSARPPVPDPYGWRLVETPDGWLFRKEPTEWNVICRAIEGKRNGRPYHDIARELDAEGAPVWNESARSYGAEPRWHAERVRRLVLRHAPELRDSRDSGKTRKQSVKPRPRFNIDTDEGFDRMAIAAAIVMGEIPAQ